MPTLADADYADVVATVVALAHTLNMQVTVEGVETKKQVSQLLALNCDYGQGFYFSQAVPADKARAILEREPDWFKVAA